VESGKREPAIVVKARFSLEDADLSKLENEFSAKVLESNELVLSKGYDNEVYFELDVDERAVVKALVGKFNLSAVNKGAVAKCKRLEEVEEALGTDQADQAGELIKIVKEILARDLTVYLYEEFIEERVPKFLYFDQYYQMSGQVNIEQLRQREQQNQLRDSERPMIALVELARLSLDQLTSPKRTEELTNRLEGASNHLTSKTLKYWSQNKNLQMQFDVRPARPEDPEDMRTGTNLWARVYNSKHRATTLLARRSRGFVWFFSFLAWFSQQARKNEKMILLLDEPGLFLHATAQGDLLKYMQEELKPMHQVIYTTHSPFMVDADRFERARIVEDKSMETDAILPEEQQGTKVSEDVLEVSEDSLFPLQGALGYEISQTLFVGPNSLVVEGVADLLYIQAMSAVLEASGKEGLRKDWTITPVGGCDKIPTYVALIGAQKGMKVATLMDIQKKDEQKMDNLYKRKLLKKKHVLTLAEFTGSREADIEDMFEVGFYLKLVNTEFKGVLASAIKEGDLDARSERIVVRIERYLQDKPLKNNVPFNHYRCARYLTENLDALRSQLSGETLGRFESAFRKLNALL
jgi:predicted ATP-dependent endonuclease of OLD family